MWLKKSGRTRLIVDYHAFIESQPCTYDQVRTVIESIDGPVQAHVDLTDLELEKVNLKSLIKVVWELHEKTFEQQFLKKIYFHGTDPWVRDVWSMVSPLFPKFVKQLIFFS